MTDTSWHPQETFKGLITLSTEGLRFISLVNGGAAVAVVAYGLGKLPNISLVWPMACFLLGTVLSGLAYIAAYVTQLAVFNESARLGNKLAPHSKWLLATGLLGLLAITSFAVGCSAVVVVLDHLHHLASSTFPSGDSGVCVPFQRGT